jgi:hypothetical protein
MMPFLFDEVLMPGEAVLAAIDPSGCRHKREPPQVLCPYRIPASARGCGNILAVV